MSLPIRTRLTIWYVGLLGVILATLGGFLVVRLRTDLVRGVDQGLDTRAAQIALGLNQGCEGEFQDASAESLVGLPQGESGAQLVSPTGSILEFTGDPLARRPLLTSGQVKRLFNGENVRATVATGPDAEPFRVFGVRLEPGTCSAAVVVATSLDDVNRSVHRLLVLLLVAGPAALLAAGVGGWVLARRALRPVARMTREARDLGVAHLDERIDVPRTADELQRLATTLNEMLDRLQRGVDEKRRFVADASHELRTPLAVMSSELDVSLRSSDLDPSSREVLSSAREEVARMNRIVENLLTLARIDEGGIELLRESLGLRDAVESATSSLGPLIEEKAIRVDIRGDDLTVDADRARLDQVLVNLIGNAVKFSPRGGEVTISIEAEDGMATCRVVDAGPGIAASVLPHVFDRFFRGDEARPRRDGGSGLGLAICREVVAAHGGRLWVESREGSGSAFTFTLPKTSAPLAIRKMARR